VKGNGNEICYAFDTFGERGFEGTGNPQSCLLLKLAEFVNVVFNGGVLVVPELEPIQSNGKNACAI